MQALKKLFLTLTILSLSGLTFAMQKPLTDDEIVRLQTAMIAKKGLFEAIENQDIGKAKMQLDFIKNVLKMKLNFINMLGDTLLIKAIALNTDIGDEIALLLIQAGADVNKADQANGNTPLHMTVLTGNVHLAQILLNAGAKTTVMNSGGYTPEHMVNELITDLETTSKPHTKRRQTLINAYMELKSMLRPKMMRR